MSEEILKALMQLFAIIVKQDEGVEQNEIKYVKTFLTQQLGDEAVSEYLYLFYEKAGLDTEGKLLETESEEDRKPKRTSVKDSVRILGLCKKINKNLNQKQKVVVLTRLFELINTERKFSEQRMAIINTVAEVFNITKEEFISIETFVIENEASKVDFTNILIVSQENIESEHCKKVHTESLNGNIFILHIKAVELFFLKYTGTEAVNLNGQIINNKSIYLFANGSTIRIPKGKPIYYSDIVAKFLSDSIIAKLSFSVENISFQFPNGDLGLRSISFSETHGKLIGIMGASGAGKTTMLNSLSGISTPTSGRVLINGIDLHHNKEEIEGLIGYIPQDDLLIEELTVFENLYFNAKQCFNKKPEAEIIQLVNTVLKNLGLFERKDLKVGSPLNKLISGGQRKRLNIALELIREPAILFVDEPTSGLSSRDSENVMDLLRELTLKGKLIFVVIHQPSSEIYKMFDKMMILDTGGYMVYYGNPVEAILYFKEIDNQINNVSGECPVCGNVNPESIFDIVEAKVVDEFGNYTDNRKVSPKHWEDHFHEKIKLEPVEIIKDKPVSTLDIPTWFKQLKIYLKRDWLSKISNKQYIAINLIESPLLGFILSYIIRYIADPNSVVYVFRENVNIPPYIFMSVVVALFIGLTVSAEEIFKDRKILKREAFLNLSRSSYLISKVIILFGLSAIQSLLFVLVGNTILGIEEMYFEYWLILFSISAGANMMGLNISSTFNSAITIYILIPLLIIPQLALGGAMFSFEKLNKTISSIEKVPIVAEVMTARWGYEALMVKQYKDNKFETLFYDIEKKISIADFKLAHYIPYLETILDEVIRDLDSTNDSTRQVVSRKLNLLQKEFTREAKKINTLELQYIEKKSDRVELKFKYIDKLTMENVSDTVLEEARTYIKKELDSYYNFFYKEGSEKKERIIDYLKENKPGYYDSRRKKYHNESLQEIVKKIYEKNPIIEYDGKLIQQIDPIYLDPEPNHLFDFRTQFFAPRKHFIGKYYDTFWFNTILIWIITLVFYVTLYFNLLKKTLDKIEGIKIQEKLKKYNFLKKIKIRRLKTEKTKKVKPEIKKLDLD